MVHEPPVSMASTELEPGSPPRTLVLCFDGTSSQYDGTNTNAVELFALLKKDDFREQLCYYQSGIGTYVKPGVVSPLFQWGAKILDEAFAIYLKDHVMDGYRFLMQNFHRGDRICIFGFSRGAYTARALAGMLHKARNLNIVGLLPRDNQEEIPFAFRLYKDTSASAIQLAADYKETFCQTVTVEFLGAWETVSSVGVLVPRTLPYTSSNNASVKTLRHAVSLDERRVRFQPYLCEPKQGGAAQTDVLEVWFCGGHADVGGGEVVNGARSVSQITLRWMVKQIIRSKCGILFDPKALVRAGISPNGSSSSKPSLDDADSLEPIHDHLSGFSPWRAVEVLPMLWSVQDSQGKWRTEFGFHLGKGRTIVDPKPKFHTTVKLRMADTALKYAPKALWTAGTEVYVD